MKVVIIDDEQEESCSLCKLVERFCSEATVVGKANNAKEGISLIESNQPDLVFLNIEVSTEKGFSILSQIENRDFHTVFVTRHIEYAIRAIKTGTLDYLLKPVDPELLIKCIQKVSEKIKDACKNDFLVENSQNEIFDRIGVPTNTGIKYLELENILFLKSHDNYTEIVQEGSKSMLISKSLKCFEKILNNTFFSRVHQSYLVNMNKVIEVQKVGGGMLILQNNHRVPVSRSRKNSIKNRLNLKWKLV